MTYLSRMPMNNQVVVPTFVQTYLLFLSTLVGFDPYSILTDLITICTFLILRFPAIRYGNLFNLVIMLFLLIPRILIYIFLFLSITVVVFTFCLATKTLTVERFAIWAG